MLIINCSSRGMLAMLGSQGGEGSCPQDNGPQYLALMLFKAIVNVLSLGSLQRSLLGLGGISLCLADTLLLCAMAGSWALRGCVATPVSLCFVMSHTSAIYSLLPVPFLLLGALDYAGNLSPSACPFTPGRALSCCAQVLTVWALAGLYSYLYTQSQVLAVREEDRTVLFCLVQDSPAVNHFCTGLCLALAGVLLFHYRRVPRLFQEVLARHRQTGRPLPGPWTELPFSRADLEEQPAVALLLRLTVGFALTWAPFLLLSTSCVLLNMPVPSYMTVHVIWLQCANSLLVGATLWFKRDQEGSCDDLPDDTCTWSLYWHHGNRGVESSLQEKLPHDIYTPSSSSSSSSTEKLLHI